MLILCALKNQIYLLRNAVESAAEVRRAVDRDRFLLMICDRNTKMQTTGPFGECKASLTRGLIAAM